jgi:hypothetical protein
MIMGRRTLGGACLARYRVGWMAVRREIPNAFIFYRICGFSVSTSMFAGRRNCLLLARPDSA